MDRWKGMEEFMAVVETGSFSQAAARLNLAVSQISKRVSELEKRLEARLLDRTTRRVTPTTQGRLFYQASRKLLGEFDRARESLQLDQDSLTGVLRLCCVGGSRPAFQMDLYRAFLDKYRGLQMEVTYHDALPDLTQTGLELALVIGDAESAATDRCFHLCWIDYALAMAPQLHESCGMPATPADLSSLPCILNGDAQWRLSNNQHSVLVPVSGRFASLNMPACIDACLSGHGIFMVPAYSIDSIVASGRLLHVLPDWHIRKSMYAVLPDSEYVPTKVILLMEFLEQTMGSDTGEAGKLIQLLRVSSNNPMALLREMNRNTRRADITGAHPRSNPDGNPVPPP